VSEIKQLTADIGKDIGGFFVASKMLVGGRNWKLKI